MHKNYSVSLGRKRLLLLNSILTLPDRLWRQMPLFKDVLLPVSYTVMTVDYSLSGVTFCMQIT